MGAITSIESSLESVETRVSDMQNSFGSKVDSESSKLFETVRNLANREADTIVKNARTKAESDSAQIKQAGADATSKIQTSIDSNFDSAVEYVVSELLKE